MQLVNQRNLGTKERSKLKNVKQKFSPAISCSRENFCHLRFKISLEAKLIAKPQTEASKVCSEVNHMQS